ncbi:MAG: hypothetical protein HND48_22395 [Chloroflexi bacterium]|nr:hypothetical protein [Chloroflexota bacterium]
MSTHLPVTIPGDSPELRRTLEQIYWGLAHDPAMGRADRRRPVLHREPDASGRA